MCYLLSDRQKLVVWYKVKKGGIWEPNYGVSAVLRLAWRRRELVSFQGGLADLLVTLLGFLRDLNWG